MLSACCALYIFFWFRIFNSPFLMKFSWYLANELTGFFFVCVCVIVNRKRSVVMQLLILSINYRLSLLWGNLGFATAACLLFAMEETSSWADLPQCLLDLIMKRLCIPDRLRFGSVCLQWCIAQKQSLSLLSFIVILRTLSRNL